MNPFPDARKRRIAPQRERPSGRIPPACQNRRCPRACHPAGRVGAAIYNREKSSANHHGWQDGQLITWADYVPPVARFDWRDQKEGNTQRRKHDKFVRTAFRAIGMPKASAATARDGAGQVNEITRSREGEITHHSSGPQRVKKNHLAPPSEEEFQKRREKLRDSSTITASLLNH